MIKEGQMQEEEAVSQVEAGGDLAGEQPKKKPVKRRRPVAGENPEERQELPRKKKPVRRRSEGAELSADAAESTGEPRPRKRRRLEGSEEGSRKRNLQRQMQDGQLRRSEGSEEVSRKRSPQGQMQGDGMRSSAQAPQKRTMAQQKMIPKQPREWTKNAIWITGLKYGVTALILAYIIFLLVVTGGTNKSFAEVEKSVESAINVSSMTKGTGQDLKRYYGLNSADYQGFMLYVSNSSMSAEEMLMVEVSDDKQLQEVENAIQDRISNRKSAFEGYAQDQADLVDASVLSVRGKYIFFTVSKDASTNKKAFADSL